MELNGKNDKAFIDSIYKLMRDMFNYKPPINKDQFFNTGYVELKALMACELINLFQQRFKLSSNTRHVNPLGTLKTHENVSNHASTNQNDNPVLIKRSASSVTFNRNQLTSKVPFLNNHRILNTNNLNLKQHDICETITMAKISKAVDIDDFSSTVSSQQNSGASSSTFCELTAKNTQLETLLRELTTKFDALSNKISCVEENMAKLQPEKSPSNMVTLTVRDYENLISRLNLMENELKLIKQQQASSIRARNSDTDKDSERFYNRVSGFSNKPDARSSLTNRGQIPSLICIEKNYDEEDSTLYETPFVSFINNSNLNESNEKENNFLECVLAQGELIKSDALSTSLQNDLTPTMEANNKREPLFKKDQADVNSLDRARSLIERASAFSEELTKKVKI